MSPVEEDTQIQSLNLSNIKQLLTFVLPYKHWMFIAIVFMFTSVIMGISFPLVSKIAIDNYIVKTYQLCPITEDNQTFVSSFSKKIKPIFLNKQLIAIPSSSIKNLDPKDTKLFIQPEKYYLFPQSSPLEKTNALLQGDYWLVTENNLHTIPPHLLLSLRGSDWQGILLLSLLGIGIIITNFIAEFFQVFYSSKAAQATMIDLRSKIFSHIETLSLDYFSKQQVGRLVTRATNDVNALNELLSTVFIQSWRDLFVLLGTIGILFWLNWQLALCVTITVPIFILTTYFFQQKLQIIYRQSRHLLSTLNAHLAEDISGFKIIKIFQQGPKRQRSYNYVNKQYFESTFREIKWFGIFRPSIEVICALGLTMVFIYGGHLALSGALTIGAFYTFITYVERMFKPLAAMVDKYNIMLSAAAASERLVQILNEKPTIISPDKLSCTPIQQGELSLRHVNFSYIPGQPILQDINLDIPAGKSVAIVGPTGSGKSSIINLLCRFYDVDSGEILIDQQQISEYNLADLRKYMAIVLQESFIFSRSVKDNLTMGANFTQEEILAATQRLQIDNFINSLPQKYDTIMEERGATLSAGQRQLLCFARALLHNPKILILDEATSNIDPETENLIQQAIGKLMQNRTCIIVAHRLSTIRQADQILVLDGGRIIERGSHHELLAKHGAYYNLYLLQYQQQAPSE